MPRPAGGGQQAGSAKHAAAGVTATQKKEDLRRAFLCLIERESAHFNIDDTAAAGGADGAAVAPPVLAEAEAEAERERESSGKRGSSKDQGGSLSDGQRAGSGEGGESETAEQGKRDAQDRGREGGGGRARGRGARATRQRI